MKYSTKYPITAANINADYRLTVDALLNFHESTVARYFTTLGVAAFGHSINLIDLDFNGHTNNRRYVNMALICFDSDFLATHRPDSLNIKFIKESRMGDEIANYTYATDGASTYVGKILNGRGEELCRVVSHWRDKKPLEDISKVNLLRNP